MHIARVQGNQYGVKKWESFTSESQAMEVCVCHGKHVELYAPGQWTLGFWKKVTDAWTLHLKHVCKMILVGSLDIGNG